MLLIDTLIHDQSVSRWGAESKRHFAGLSPKPMAAAATVHFSSHVMPLCFLDWLTQSPLRFFVSKLRCELYRMKYIITLLIECLLEIDFRSAG